MPTTGASKEKRVCPDDGKTYTFDELKKAYAGPLALQMSRDGSCLFRLSRIPISVCADRTGICKESTLMKT